MAKNLVKKKVKPKVLKTDAFNEVESENRPNGGWCPVATELGDDVVLVEYELHRCLKAKNRYPAMDIRQGDIRDLPCADQEFDVVVDLSTIDHIPPNDLPATLAGYGRVLKDGGLLGLLAWCSDDKRDWFTRELRPDLAPSGPLTSWHPTDQYYFHADYLRDLLVRDFEITHAESIIRRGKRFMLAIEARRNDRASKRLPKDGGNDSISA